MPALSLLLFFVIERSVLMVLVFIAGYVRKGNDTKKPAILGFFFIVERTQLKAAHAQLFEKLRPIAFAETCRFLTIQSLDFQETWQKIVQKSRE